MQSVKRRWSSYARRSLSSCNMYSLALLFMVLCVCLLVVNIYELRLMQADHVTLHGRPGPSTGQKDVRKDPVVWIYGQKLEIGYMKHVIRVFERIGFSTGDSESDWDVLWSHDYPFKTLSAYLNHLKPHQKVNHFPGSGALTNKVQLVTSAFDFIPKAFQMPRQKNQFLEYVKENPNKMWVQKNNNHRGIKILSVEGLNLDSANSFVQEYVDDPLLIDGRRFDVGLYVTLTSVDPLRVYTFQGEWLIRFCSKDYYPFDRTDVEKYVITDDYTPLWEIPSLAKLYKESDLTRKDALFSYLRRIGKDPEVLKQNLENAVRRVFYAKENNITSQTAHYSSRNFFEMVRFDFLVKKDLTVSLMEVNMSPNLSSGHFAGNKLLYEQVVFGLLRLIGVTSAVRTDKMIAQGDNEALEMQVSSKDLKVYLENCSSTVCSNCQPLICRVCTQCMTKKLESTLGSAYLEHLNRHTWRRVIPKAVELQNSAKSWNPEEDDDFQQLSETNQMMSLWFNGKCIQDGTWCR